MTEPNSNQQAVTELYYDLLERWNERDAKGMAGLVIPEGFLIGFDGSQHDGPAEIESTLREIFERHPTATYVAKVKSVRLLSNDVAVLNAIAGMVPPGESDINPALNAVQTLVAVKRDHSWRVAVLQNTPAEFHGRPNLSEQLTRELQEVFREQNSGKHKDAGTGNSG